MQLGNMRSVHANGALSFDNSEIPWQTARQSEHCEDLMATTKEARGTKRTCQNEDCEAKFYDLNRDPILCPVCQTVYQLAAAPEEEVVPVAAVVQPKPAAASTPADGEEVADDDDALVSLEDADAELGADDDDADDDTFLPDDDDDDDPGVGDIIVGVDKEDEDT